MALQLPGSMSSSTLAAINSVISAYDSENLRHALATYPQRIKRQREAVQQARTEYRRAEQSRAEAEASLVLAISIDTDERGKAKYPNAEARSAALAQCKRDDPDYADAADTAAKAEADLTEAQDALTMLLDEYQSARIAARLIAAEMSVLSELIDVGEREEVSAEGAVKVEIPEVEEAMGGGFGIGKPAAVRANQHKEAF